MSAKRKDGGTAFPINYTSYNNVDVTHETEGGMALRDWLAGQALAGLMGSGHEAHYQQLGGGERLAQWSDRIEREWAEYCYRMADAMLAERQK